MRVKGNERNEEATETKSIKIKLQRSKQKNLKD